MKYFFLALSVVILFAACSKTTTPASSTISILTTGKWKISSGTLTIRKPNGLDTVLDYTHWIPYCHRDDYIRFYSATTGYSYPGNILCDPSEDSTTFSWYLTNGGNTMNLQGFNFSYAATDSVVDPVFFDTISKTPTLVLDTVINAAAALATGGVVVLDSTWKLYFDTTAISWIRTYDATITNLSSSSFTLNYGVITTYQDSTNHHTGPPNARPINRPDTIYYSVTYSPY